MPRRRVVGETVLDVRPPGHAPLFSIVIALFNSEHTLGTTLASFDAQLLSQDKVEFIIVNDGSSDRSLEVALSWGNGRSNTVILDKPHGGIASTRNAALREARGKWITAVDPDDLISPRYLSEVATFLECDSTDRLVLLSTRVMPTRDVDGRFSANHPLDGKFRSGNRMASLLCEPGAFAIGATTFLRLAKVEDFGLQFDDRVSPTFEDGNFILRYLCHFEEPLVGLVASAH